MATRLAAFAFLIGAAGSVGAAAAERSVGTVETFDPTAIQNGRVAYVHPRDGKIIEIAPDGKVTWEYAIPGALQNGGDLFKGADIEWIAQTDGFLFVIPKHGVFEVTRDKKIVWSYRTDKISHDADRLPNGNTIFVNGWDNDDDPTVTEITKGGRIVFQWFARDHVDRAARRGTDESAYSFAHANAVQRLRNGATVVSLRNFNRYVILKDGKIVSQTTRARRVHDPHVFRRGAFFAIHGGDRPGIVRVNPDRTRTYIFSDPAHAWQPIRTVEVLRNSNILITGSERIGQIDPKGRLVWAIRLDGFASQGERTRSGQRQPPFVYKAAWVYR